MVAAALAIVTFVVYARVAQFSFVNFDDPDYVKMGSLGWAFTSTEAGNWFPVTRLSHMLDARLFGAQSGWHHLVSVAIHAAAAAMLFRFLARATGARGRSAFVAFVFALHPLHVESVAWIAERKDVLCAFFWFVALDAHAAGRRRVALAAFVLGLMSKPMIVTLPFVLLLIDVWPLRRGLRVREKLPLFAVAAAGVVVTYWTQHAAGAVGPMRALAFQNALVSCATYIEKTFWPSGLAVFYPYPAELALWRILLAGAALATLTAWVLREFRSHPYLAVGWCWFLGTLAPVIGIVQVGQQARADRYVYVPMVGLLIMVAWGGAELLDRWPRARIGAAVAACGACAVLSWIQLGYWQDSGTLFSRALAVTGPSYLVVNNLGAHLMDHPARLDEAVEHLRTAVRLRPESGQAHANLGNALTRAGLVEEAAAELEKAVRITPNNAGAHNDLGVLLWRAQGNRAEAIAQFREALRIDPTYGPAQRNLEKVQRSQ
jgi:tetratricopeptide (TPR) repeat protein